MYGVSAIPWTELVELDLAGDLLFVAVRVVVTTLALHATEADEVVCVFDLCHVSLCELMMISDLSRERDSNPPPHAYQACALPDELSRLATQVFEPKTYTNFRVFAQ